MTLFINLLGWAGTVAVLLAYVLVSTHRASPASFRFQGLNAFGAVALGINTLHYHALPSVALNVVWLAIALYVYGLTGLPWVQRRLHPVKADTPEAVQCRLCDGWHVPNGIGLPCVPYDEW